MNTIQFNLKKAWCLMKNGGKFPCNWWENGFDCDECNYDEPQKKEKTIIEIIALPLSFNLWARIFYHWKTIRFFLAVVAFSFFVATITCLIIHKLGGF